MRETAGRQPWWYWAVIGTLLLVGVGAWCSSSNGSNAAILASPRQHDDEGDPTVDELAAEFRQFREEVSQLEPLEQQEVWQGLHDRADSLAERTLFRFFSLALDQQEMLVDRTIDRVDARRRMYMEMGWGQPGGSPPQPGEGRDRWPVREVTGAADWNRPFAELSLEERLAARRDMWEDATMRAHAMRYELYRLMGERRKVRGLPEMMRRWG